MDEFARIHTYFAPLATAEPGAFDLKDDAAMLTPKAGEQLVITQDTLVENIHFPQNEHPFLVAQKSLRVNLSDLIAKGAKPHCYFLSLSLPEHTDEKWLANFVEGLAEDQKAYGITLMGGDSTRSPHSIVITVTAIGTTSAPMIQRKGAKPGDTIYVSGTIGDSGLGHAILQGQHPQADASTKATLKHRYQQPNPRIELIDTLQRHAHAAMDVSDGLLQDLRHLCETSGVGAKLELEKIPLSGAAQNLLGETPSADDLLMLATAGDDYEVLFTAAENTLEAMPTPVTAIGKITDKADMVITPTYNGKHVTLPERLGYRHY
ncbi:MAG: thiamine-phosphate kinase [Rickettsiales bacterium]